MINATINLPTLRCHEQWDANGLSEPYLWTAFFWADVVTISRATKVLVHVPFSQSSLRDRFPDGVDDGQDISIPPEIGGHRMRLDDGGNNLVMLGVLIVLLEQDNTGDDVMRNAHNIFRQSVTTELNQFVNENGATRPSEEQVKAIASAIERTTSGAVRSQIHGFDIFLSHDSFLGYTFTLLVGSEVTNPNGNNLIFPLIEKDEFRPSFTGGPPVKVGHQRYEIVGGRLTVEPFVPDPCAPQVLALNRALAAVQQIQQSIRTLQEQLSSASPAEKRAILQEVREIRATELPPALDAVDLAQEALAACRNAN
jgi:hypothetical protein